MADDRPLPNKVRKMSGKLRLTARAEASPDRRVQRTRALLTSAFTQLFLQRGFDAIGISDIVERANVGRSTFYDHFDNKGQLLTLSVLPFLTVLADTCVQETMPEQLPVVLAHFWENRRNAHRLFTGEARTLLVASTTDLIEERLTRLPVDRSFPWRLAAAQLAMAQLGLLEEWLQGRLHCSPMLAAELLHTHAYAGATALRAKA